MAFDGLLHPRAASTISPPVLQLLRLGFHQVAGYGATRFVRVILRIASLTISDKRRLSCGAQDTSHLFKGHDFAVRFALRFSLH